MQVTIEYMILIPILIMQIFLFPIAVGGMMEHWADSRREIALQETVGHMGSAIQQIYYSLNHTSILTGNLVNELGVPPLIEGFSYVGNASLSNINYSGSKILEITLSLTGTSIFATTSVTLGTNVEWGNSTLTSTAAEITAQKYWNGMDHIIRLDFGN